MLLAVAIRDDDRQAPVGGEGQRAEHATRQERARHARNQFPVRDADGRVATLDAQSLQRIRAQALAGQPAVQPSRAARRLDRVEKIRDGQNCTPRRVGLQFNDSPCPRVACRRDASFRFGGPAAAQAFAGTHDAACSPPVALERESPASMRTGLIVTTYNWPEALHLTLASVARQTHVPDEVIVADDGSGPATRAVVERWRAAGLPLEHVWQEDEGFRLARSRNRAIASTRAEYILLVDGDMILHPQFVADHMRCARPDCFIQGARPQLSAATTAQFLHGSGPTAVGPLDARSAATRLRDSQPAAQPRLLPDQGHARRRAGLQPVLLAQPRNPASTATTSASPPGARKTANSSPGSCTSVCAGTTCATWQLRFICITRRVRPTAPNPFDRLLEETLARRATWTEQGLAGHLDAAGPLRRGRARAAPLRGGR